jgi:type III pantothenate kinase
VRPFPTNTSDALTSGGTYAIAGAVERMVAACAPPLRRRAALHHDRRCRLEDGTQHVAQFELVDNLIFDGLLEMAARRFA